MNYRTTADCMPHLLDKKNVEMLTSHKVFSEDELKSRCDIMLENYCKTIVIEARTMTEMARTQIAPAVEAYISDIAQTALTKKSLDADIACSYETELIRKLSLLTERIAEKTSQLEEAV